ncbi:MAG: hypothetical protein RL357_1508 [Pseudomonadota bacterium]
MPELRRIGVLGGAFDPPHRAHVALAQAAVTQLSLDLLWIVPTGHAWHKARALSDGRHRLAMAELAFLGVPQARVTDLELRRTGPSYTVDTLEELQMQAKGSEAEWFLLMGADQAQAFHTWQRQADILARARLAVANRGTDDAFEASPLANLPWPMTLIDMPRDPVSSTLIRNQLRSTEQAQTDQSVLDEAVAGYIAQHNLYQNT